MQKLLNSTDSVIDVIYTSDIIGKTSKPKVEIDPAILEADAHVAIILSHNQILEIKREFTKILTLYSEAKDPAIQKQIAKKIILIVEALKYKFINDPQTIDSFNTEIAKYPAISSSDIRPNIDSVDERYSTFVSLLKNNGI